MKKTPLDSEPWRRFLNQETEQEPQGRKDKRSSKEGIWDALGLGEEVEPSSHSENLQRRTQTEKRSKMQRGGFHEVSMDL